MYGSLAPSSSPREENGTPKLRIVTPMHAEENGVVFDSTTTPLGSPVGVEADDFLARRGVMNVFIPVVSSVFGVIIFMRLGMIVGVVGLLKTWGIVAVAFTITVLSIGSMSALATSTCRRTEGTFRFYSSLVEAMGPYAGHAVMILMFLSCGTASAYYVLGFSEITMFYLGVDDKSYPLPWNSDGSLVTTLLASGTQGLLVLGLCYGGSVGNRLLKLVFIIVMVGVGCNILFLVVPNTSTETGVSRSHFQGNLAGYASHKLFKVFGEFFPAFCGTVAGIHVANSFDLSTSRGETSRRRQQESAYLITGTHKALAFCCVIYTILSAVLAAAVDSRFLRQQRFVVQLVVDSILGVPAVYLAIAATTLTSALSNVVAAVSVCNRSWEVRQSSVYNDIQPSTLEFKASSRRAIVMTWCMTQAAILCGSVDSIIPMVSSSFLVLFAVVNFACFYFELSSLIFRPTFILYNKWSALLGFCLSVGALFVVMSSFVVGCMIVGSVAALASLQNALPDLVGSIRRDQANSFDRDEALELERTHREQGSELKLLNASDRSDDYTRRIELAALYVRDSLHGRFLGEEYVSEGLHKLKIKRWYHALQVFRLGNMAVLLGLSFFEIPAWCYFSRSCGDPSHTLMWNLPRLPREVSSTIELLNLAILLLEAMLKYKYLGRRLYFVNKWHILHLILLFSDIVSILLVVFVPRSDRDGKDQLRPAVLSPVIRPLLLLTMSERLRSGFVSLLRVLPRVMDGLLTLLVLIVMYSICGMVMFEGTPEGRQFFPNFETASMNMLILLTTANFPDVMMPTYDQARYTSVFFVSFLMIGLLLVMNLVFASMYQNYRQEVTQRAVRYATRRQQSLEFAFRLLPAEERQTSERAKQERVVSRRTLEDLISELLRPVIPLFETKDPGMSYWNTPSDSQGTNRREDFTFQQFTAKIRGFAARQKSSSRNGARALPFEVPDTASSAFLRGVQQCVRSKWFEYIVDVLILGNLVVIQFEIQAKIDGNDGGYMLWEEVMPFFSYAYLVEMVLKIYSFSLQGYFARVKNRFDCIVTLVIIVAEVSVQVHYTAGMDWQWMRILLFLRFLRCLRLLVALQGLSTMFSVVLRLLPAFTTLYGMLGIVMMEYAAIGVQHFGGKLVVGDARLAETTYGKSNYYANNFNDFPSALTTLFELLLVNNWNVIMEGTEVVSTKWSRAYFISYYIIAVVMMLNLVVAFVVEAYFEQCSANDERSGQPVTSSAGATLTSLSPSGAGSSQSLQRTLADGAIEHDGSNRLRKRSPVVMRPRGDSVYVEEFL